MPHLDWRPAWTPAPVAVIVTAIAAALGCLGVPIWVALTRFDVLRAGHPAYPVALAVAVLVGVAWVGWVLRRSRQGWQGWQGKERRPRKQGRAARQGWWRVVRFAAAFLVTAVAVGALTWLRPAGASPVATQAMAGSADVSVAQSATSITLTPTHAPSEVGVVFQPGAKVDPRAYAALLSKVAASGHTVVIVKQPFDIAFTALGAPKQLMDDHPQVRRWVVAGHSLGGVAAALSAASGDSRIVGLILWASYPDASTTISDLATVSISGTNDGLATPADIQAARARLPATTTYVAVPGGIHAYFGDYGAQSGDGQTTLDRDTAQRRIVAATIDFLPR